MIIVLGVFEVAAEGPRRFLEEKAAQVTATRAETGCLDYAFSADAADPGRVRLVERWETMADLEAHVAALRSTPAAAASAGGVTHGGHRRLDAQVGPGPVGLTARAVPRPTAATRWPVVAPDRAARARAALAGRRAVGRPHPRAPARRGALAGHPDQEFRIHSGRPALGGHLRRPAGPRALRLAEALADRGVGPGRPGGLPAAQLGPRPPSPSTPPPSSGRRWSPSSTSTVRRRWATSCGGPGCGPS